MAFDTRCDTLCRVQLGAVQEAIRQAVISASGTTDVQWQGSARAARFGKGPQIDLVLRGAASIGQDETRRGFDPDEDVLTETQSGNRHLPVSIRIEADTQKPGENAQAVAMRLRARLSRSNVLDALQAGNVALVEVMPTINADYRDQDARKVSLAVVDVLFATTENDANDAISGDYIATAEIHSEYLLHPDGSQAPVQIEIEGP